MVGSTPLIVREKGTYELPPLLVAVTVTEGYEPPSLGVPDSAPVLLLIDSQLGALTTVQKKGPVPEDEKVAEYGVPTMALLEGVPETTGATPTTFKAQLSVATPNWLVAVTVIWTIPITVGVPENVDPFCNIHEGPENASVGLGNPEEPNVIE